MPSRFLKTLSFRLFLEWILKRPLVVIACFVAISIFFALQIPKLAFRTSIYELLIDDLPETIRYVNFKKVFGSDEIIQVVVKADNILDPAAFKKIEVLSETFSAIPGVKRVISLPVIKNKVDPGGKWTIEEFAKVAAPVELFKNNLISADHKVGAITLVLESEAVHESVIGKINDIISKESGTLSLYQIGMPLVSQALVKYTIKDFQLLPILALALIVLSLFVLLQSPGRVLLPLLVVMVVLTWTLGSMALMQIHLSLLTMIVPVFLIAIGTAYCLHIISEYILISQYGGTGTRKEAVNATFSHTALPCTLVVFTTLIGVGSLFVNNIRAIHEFALSASIGIVVLLMTVIVLLPAVLVFIPRSEKKMAGGAGIRKLLDRLLNTIIQLNLKQQRALFYTIGILSMLAAEGIFFIHVETNPVEYFKEDTPISRNFHDIHEKLSGSLPINVVVESNQDYYFEDPQHIAEIKRFQQYLETLPNVDKSISFADYVMLVNYALNQYDSKYYVLPEQDYETRMAINNYKGLLGEDMFSAFMTPELDKANILLLTYMSSTEDFLAAREKILAHAGQYFPEHVQVAVTGFGMAVSASSHLLTIGQIKSLTLSLALIFVVMYLLFLSGKVGLIALLPNCFPILMNFGIMGWLGIPLSASTSMIASIAIGLAVDDTIHYLYRYNREFKKDLDKDRALRDTIKNIGRPIIFTTLTICIGFSVLMFSHFKPTATFGFLMVITMVTALIGDLLLLPALMLHVELVTAWDLLKLMPNLAGLPGGLAHELIQPLTAIKMGSDILLDSVSRKRKLDEKHVVEILNKISNQTDRASEIVHRLRTFGEPPGFKREPMNINDPIMDVISIIRYQLSLENIELKLELDENLPPVVGHKNRLGQVVYNLLTNAHEAIHEAKQADGRSGPHLINVRSFQKNNRVIFTVSDTGIGILANDLGRIFEPFFTTKAIGQGKGLGLSICNQIVREFGGRITVESQPNKGTTVKVAFPCIRP
jgi:predicted RND superfamily exporter protein